MNFTSDTNKFIGTIADFSLTSEYIYILEKETSFVYQFNKYSGEYINGIFNVGRGAEEHIEICHIDTDNELVYVLDNMQNKISIYNSTLNCISSIKLPIPTLSFSVCNDTIWGKGFSVESGKMQIYSCNSKGEMINSLYLETNISDPLASFSMGGNTFTKHASHIYYKPEFKNSIEQISFDSLVNTVKINFHNLNIANSDSFQDIMETKAVIREAFVTTDNIYISYLYNGETYVCLYDFTSHETKYGKIKYNSNELPFVIRWQNNNTLIGYNSVTSVKEYKGLKLNDGDILIALMNKVK